MARKRYKNDGLMKFLTVIGALIGLYYLIIRILGLAGYGYYYWAPRILPEYIIANLLVHIIIGFVFVILTFLSALKPEDPIPFHWLVLFILAILLIVFVSLLSGLLVLIASLIGLIEEF